MAKWWRKAKKSVQRFKNNQVKPVAKAVAKPVEQVAKSVQRFTVSASSSGI